MAIETEIPATNSETVTMTKQELLDLIRSVYQDEKIAEKKGKNIPRLFRVGQLVG